VGAIQAGSRRQGGGLVPAWARSPEAIRKRSGRAHRPVDVTGTPSVSHSGWSSGIRSPKRGCMRQRAEGTHAMPVLQALHQPMNTANGCQRASAVFPGLRSNGSLTQFMVFLTITLTQRASATAMAPSVFTISRPRSSCSLTSTSLARVTLVISAAASPRSRARADSLVASWSRRSSVPRERLASLL
jgi:hypothetical protein